MQQFTYSIHCTLSLVVLQGFVLEISVVHTCFAAALYICQSYESENLYIIFFPNLWRGNCT
jgi:hypothetical protein